MKIYQDIFISLTFPCLVLEPLGGQFLIKEANNEFINALSIPNGKLIGMSIPEVFPENPEHLGTSWEEIYNSLNKAFENGKTENLEVLRYDILCCETNEFGEAYWQIENIPVKDEATGKVAYILFIAIDITLQVLEKKR